jgi:hypothetical protein
MCFQLLPAVLDDWTIWFVELSGWPVFLTLTMAVVIFSFIISMFLSRAANRSAVQVMVVAVLVLVAICLLLLMAAVWWGHVPRGTS